MPASETTDSPIRIGISACLLGRKVRFDGGHKHDRFITETLGQYFEWISVCPEIEMVAASAARYRALRSFPKVTRDWSAVGWW